MTGKGRSGRSALRSPPHTLRDMVAVVPPPHTLRAVAVSLARSRAAALVTLPTASCSPRHRTRLPSYDLTEAAASFRAGQGDRPGDSDQQEARRPEERCPG